MHRRLLESFCRACRSAVKGGSFYHDPQQHASSCRISEHAIKILLRSRLSRLGQSFLALPPELNIETLLA